MYSTHVLPFLIGIICTVWNSAVNGDVIALNDETFEHLTQSSTGATTGDWIVLL